MTIEEYIIQYLDGVLDVPVSGDVPSPLQDSFVTVEMTGGGEENKIRDATIAVQSWEISRDAAAQLNDQVITAMEAMEARPEISRCSLDTCYNYTDITRKKPRYQAVFTVVHYLT